MSPKPFFVLIVFLFFIAAFAGGAIGDANLTDGGQSQPLVRGSSGVSSNSSSGIDYNVFADSASDASAAGSQPVTIVKNNTAETSLCGSMYTVKAGDTLSRIAQACGVSLQDVLAANPLIQNPNVIQVGQKITIITAPADSKPTAVPLNIGD